MEDITMARKQNPEQSVADVVAETGPPKTRSFGINHFHVVGRMTAAAELRYTSTGKPVVNFGIATTAAGVTTFLDLVAWQGAAETLAQYGGKGRELYVEGRIATRTREIDGHRVKQVDLVVERFQLLGRRLAVASELSEELAVEGAA
jgi:single-strand DNA-binding protein